MLEVDAFQHQAHDSTVSLGLFRTNQSTDRRKFLTSDERIGHIFSASFLSFTTPALRPGIDQQILSLLPSRKQAIFLFEFYVKNIIPFCYIIHVPTVDCMLNTVYTRLENNQQPQHNHVALLSTIIALGAYFAPPSSRSHFNGTEAKHFSYQWIFVAQRALLAANYISEPTLETLQSIILIAQHLLLNTGPMATSRTLMASALIGAQHLSLHRLDSPANKKLRESTQVDWIDIEVKRRIWWHLASTEWLVWARCSSIPPYKSSLLIASRMGTYMSGSQWGTYMIDPKHMQVELPTNVDDIDINSSGVYGRPLDSVPTDMTYCLIRAKLSISIREIVDSANNTGCSPDSLPYDVVLLFDKKINESIIDFARVTSRYDAKDHLQHKEVENQFHKLPLLSLMAEFCPQTKLIRLHRPYLARGARDPKYAYSRMMCLRSARCVIELGMKIMDSDEEFAPNRMWTIIYHFFVSVLVLVMDYSLNRKEPREYERKAEILDCFKWLEANQESSTLAKRALRQLRELLSKGVVKGDPGGKGNPPLIQTDAGLARLNSQNSHIQQGDAQSLIEPSVVQCFDSTTFDQFGQEDADPFTQYNGSSTDFALMDDLDFNVDLDESQFETFFNHIEEGQSMHRALQ